MNRIKKGSEMEDSETYKILATAYFHASPTLHQSLVQRLLRPSMFLQFHRQYKTLGILLRRHADRDQGSKRTTICA